MSEVQVLEQVNRFFEADQAGGGKIVRTLFVQPCSAAPAVLKRLYGTITGPTAGVYTRVKPHNDPQFANYYCNFVQAFTFDEEAISGSKSTGFVPSATPSIEQTNIGTALNNVEDFDYGSIVDFAPTPVCSIAHVAAGGVASGTSAGNNGALIVAIYRPLVFLDGIDTETQDPFDFCDPQRTAVELIYQTGRNLFLLSPNLAGQATLPVFDWGGGLVPHSGLSDTFNKAEIVWHFSLRRLMVPKLPQLTLGAFANKINAANASLGAYNFPAGTLRLDKATDTLKQGPDGTQWYEIELNFSYRLLYDEFFDPTTYNDAPGPYPAGFVKGWVDWNHHFGIPCERVTGVQIGPAGYYPVIWNSGLFQIFGTGHPAYLNDSDVDTSFIPNFVGPDAIESAPFLNGFKVNQ